jgi:hypothetical protein
MIERRRLRVVMPDRLRETGGFALAMAIFALVLLAAVVAGGYYSASQEFQIGRGMRSLTTSLYAGEAGIREVLADWDPVLYSTIGPGDTFALAPVSLPGGGSYTAQIVRVGRAADSLKRYFYIQAVGRPPGPNLGERRQAMVVRARFPDICCQAAAKVYDEVEWNVTLGPTSKQITGYDTDPPSWAPSVCASFPSENLPGVRIRNPSEIDLHSRIAGWPDSVVADGTLTQATLFNNTSGLTFDDMVQLADYHFPAGYSWSGDSNPSLDASGRCNRADPDNWGEPDDESHPCFDFFPMIHVAGNLNMTGNGTVQGILLVEGNVTIQGPFKFYGLILMRPTTGTADLQLISQAEVYGGVLGEDVDFDGPLGEVYFSSCAVERAERLSNLARPVPVSPRAWVELF